jgi:putative transposase
VTEVEPDDASVLRRSYVRAMYPPRVETPGSLHHIGTRGNNRRLIYIDDGSRHLFLLRLAIVIRRHDWTLISYCLVDNHYHLIIKLGSCGMSNGMRELNGGFAQAFNFYYQREDHLFGRRFWNREIEDDDDLCETARYIDLNPCRKGLARRPEDWRWSGYRAAVGIERVAPWHQPAELWGVFDKQPRVAMKTYERYVAEIPADQPRPVSDTGGRIRLT